MNKTMKRVLTLALAMLMLLSLTVTAFADDGEVYPATGTVTVYRTDKSGESYVTVTLASGSKNFTIKRSSVTVKPGTTGAALVEFNKHRDIVDGEYDYGMGQWDKGGWYDCNYTATLRVSAAGTATVKYKIGTTSYTLKVKVLDYVNPVKTITLTGVNSGKSFAARTNPSTYATKSLALKKTTKNAVLKVTAKSGWKINSVGIQDQTTGAVRIFANYSGVSSATLKWGTLNKAHIYSIELELVNTKNGASMTVSYSVIGSAAEALF